MNSCYDQLITYYVIETFDEFERLLQDKISVKDTISDSTMYLEQNIVTNGNQNGKQGGKGGSKPKGGGKPKGDSKTADTKPKGAIINPTTEVECYLCEGKHKLKECKLLPVMQQVIKTLKHKAAEKRGGQMQTIVAAALEDAVNANAAPAIAASSNECDFILEIKHLP